MKRYERPWMKSKELDIISEVLLNLRPHHCLEWGSGYSTAYFPALVKEIKNWYAVEHNKSWYKTISREVPEQVHIQCIEPDIHGDNVPEEVNDREKFRSYIQFADTIDEKLDFIFIDGRARKECLKKAYEIIRDDGIVILHDANRLRYREDMPLFKSSVLFTDHRKTRGGMWIGSKTRDIASVLRIRHHKRIWKVHKTIARLMFSS